MRIETVVCTSTLLGCLSSVQYLYIHVPIRQPRSLWRGSVKARSPCAVSVHTSHTRTVAWSRDHVCSVRAKTCQTTFIQLPGRGRSGRKSHRRQSCPVWFLHLASTWSLTGRARSKNDRQCATSRSFRCHRHWGDSKRRAGD